MALRDMFKINRKTFFNPTGWLDYNSLKAQNRTIFTILKFLFTVQKPEREETFEQAMERLKLSEEAVRFGATNYRIYALIFMLIGLLTLFYSFYLLFRYWAILGWMLGVACSALFLAQSFKYDFWSLQMRRRKLGLTIDDWLETIVGGKGNKNGRD